MQATLYTKDQRDHYRRTAVGYLEDIGVTTDNQLLGRAVTFQIKEYYADLGLAGPYATEAMLVIQGDPDKYRVAAHAIDDNHWKITIIEAISNAND